MIRAHQILTSLPIMQAHTIHPATLPTTLLTSRMNPTEAVTASNQCRIPTIISLILIIPCPILTINNSPSHIRHPRILKGKHTPLHRKETIKKEGTNRGKREATSRSKKKAFSGKREIVNKGKIEVTSKDRTE